MARILDRAAKATLLKSRHPGNTARKDLALVIRETPEELRIKIVDHTRLLERIRALLGLIPLLAERRIDSVRVWSGWHCHDDISSLLNFCLGVAHCLSLFQALLEAVYTPSSINKRLLAGIEWVRL